MMRMSNISTVIADIQVKQFEWKTQGMLDCFLILVGVVWTIVRPTDVSIRPAEQAVIFNISCCLIISPAVSSTRPSCNHLDSLGICYLDNDDCFRLSIVPMFRSDLFSPYSGRSSSIRSFVCCCCFIVRSFLCCCCVVVVFFHKEYEMLLLLLGWLRDLSQVFM